MAAPNLLDRLIATVAPEAALKRMAARNAFEAISGPAGDGAPQSPTNKRWRTTPRSADADIVRGLPRQRAESRELVATNPIGSGAIGTNIDRVVGTGLVPVPDPIGALLNWTEEQVASFKAAAIREFAMFSDSRECTLEGNQTFYERQQLVLGSRLISGDCFTILPDKEPTPTFPFSLRLQLIEADRCGNPLGAMDTADQVAGVKLVGGAASSYFIYDRHPGSLPSTKKLNAMLTGQWYDRVGESGRIRILHHYRPTRPEQTRGVPYLAPVIQAIKDLGRYTEAEITAAVLSAFYTVFIEQDATAGGPAPIFGAAPPSGPADQSNPAAGAEIAMGPGAIIGLNKNERAVFADPKRPNTAYEPFVTGILTLVGMGLKMPVELLIKKFNSSYSASKAALLDAWQHFRTERAWLVNSFCQPSYEAVLSESIARGRLTVPGFFTNPLVRWAVTRATWHGDSMGSINLKDEVDAYLSAIDGRLVTHERASWELYGSDWTQTTYPVLKREILMMRADGVEANPKAGAAAPNRPADPPSTPPSDATPDPQTTGAKE